MASALGTVRPASQTNPRSDLSILPADSSSRVPHSRAVLLPLASLIALAPPALLLRAQPAPRACHSAATVARGIAVWGGAAACGVDVVRDSALWDWNGRQWHSRSGPPILPREDGLLLGTPGDSSLTLIGGRRDGTVFSDVWRFDGRMWSRVSAIGGPGAIQHGAAAYDPVRRRIVVFGGAVGRTFGGHTYEWDGTRWHAFAVPGPAPRVGHGMAWSEADGGVLLYGGFAGERFRDLWKWDGQRWSRLADGGPTFIEGHVIAEADSGIFIVGPGLADATRVRAWRWHRGAFRAVGDALAPLAVGATATYDRTRGVLVYWGGRAADGASRTPVYELMRERWRPVTTPDEP